MGDGTARIRKDEPKNIGGDKREQEGRDWECGNGTGRHFRVTDIRISSHCPPSFLFFFLCLPSSRNNLCPSFSCYLVRQCCLVWSSLLAPVRGPLAACTVSVLAVFRLPTGCADRSSVHYWKPSSTRILLRQVTSPISSTAR